MPNYLAHARCLAQSCLEQHPEAKVFVLSVAPDGGLADPAAHPFTVVPVGEIGIPEFELMSFRYSPAELCTAVKPFFLKHILERSGAEVAVYLDPDILLFQPLAPVLAALDRHDIVLIPHLLDPLDDRHKPTEVDILLAGVYNLGFIALRRSAETLRLLDWWMDRLRTRCLNEVESGYFVDQRWADLIPCYFDRVHILRDDTCDVAYWNIGHRRPTRRDGVWVVNGRPLVFYHFSGFLTDDSERISMHCTRYRLSDLPEMHDLFSRYGGLLRENGHETCRGAGPSYSRFDNGAAIPAEARRLWRRFGAEAHWPTPFRCDGPDSFFRWLNEPAMAHGGEGPLLTNLSFEVFRRRSDLYAHFPDPRSRDRSAYLHWFVTNGASQHRLDEAFVEPVRRSLASTHAGPARAGPTIPSFWRRALRYPLRRIQAAHRAAAARLSPAAPSAAVLCPPCLPAAAEWRPRPGGSADTREGPA